MSEEVDASSRVLAVDLGDARIGVAVSDLLGMTATPLDPLQAIGPRKDLAQVERVAREWSAETVLIGWPRSLDGSTNERAEQAEAFARELARRNPRWNVELCDERFSTVEAERNLADAGVRGRKRRQKVDGAAAAILLQAYLDGRPPTVS